MTSPLVEGLESRIALLPNFLQQITNEVALGLEATPGINQEKLFIGFVKHLEEKRESMRKQICPGGEDYEIMKDLYGNSFTGRPFRDRFEMVTQIVAMSEAQQNELASHHLDKVWDAYNATDSMDKRASNVAWKTFVEAFKRYNGSVETWNEHKLKGHIRRWWRLRPETYILLPTLITTDPERYSPNPLDKSDCLINSELQTQVARAAGILLPNETLVDFTHRGNMKEFNGSHQVLPEDEGLIIADVKDTSYNWQGARYVCIKAKYFNIPTRYADTKADIDFDSSYTKVRREGRLEDLITNGDLTPEIILRVPTNALLFIDT